MSQLPIYSGKDVKITWAGHTFVGLMADSAIVATPTSDVAEMEKGLDNKAAITMLSDTGGSIEIAFQQTSPTSTQILTGILETQRTTGEMIQSDLTVFDKSGSISLINGRGAFISARPTITGNISQSGNSFVWTFLCEELLYRTDPLGVSSNITNGAKQTVEGLVNIYNATKVQQ